MTAGFVISWRLRGTYVHRVVDDELDELFGPLAAVLLDEWHHVPPLWDAAKRAVDRRVRRAVPADRVDAAGGNPALLGS